MGFKEWLQGAFGAGKGARAARVLTLRDAAVARQFPLHTARENEGRRRGHPGTLTCDCGGALEELLVTTGGAGADAALWRSYPLAVDGWLCAACSKITLPRFLEPDEVSALGQAGADAARKGELDEAELCFRRITNAWPGYWNGHNDVATVLGMRLVDAERRGAPTRALLHELKHHLGEALQDAPPEERPRLAHLLARAWLRDDDDDAVAAACAAVDAVVARATTPTERGELDEVRKWVVGRGDLYDRGVERVEPHLRIGVAWQAPEGAARAAVESGVRDLLRHVEATPQSWQALWLAGKGRQALGDAAGAVALFQRATVIEPQQVDVRRELSLTLQEAGDHAGAVAASEAACALAPDDAGLRCNLALAQLLQGDVDAAHVSAIRAVEMDPRDPINRNVLSIVSDVKAGKRKRPTSAKELGGG